MSTSGFDERQVAARGRVAMISFVALLVLTGANGVLNDTVGPWATGTTQASVLFTLSFGLFAVLAAWHGCYLQTGRSQRALTYSAGAITALLAVMLAPAVVTGSLQVVDGTRAGTHLVQVLMLVMWASVTVAAALRERADRRAEAAAEADLAGDLVDP